MINRLLEGDAWLSTNLRLAEKSSGLRALAAILAHSGDSWFWLIGLGILWLLGTEVWKYRALVLAGGILLTALIVLLIKFTVRRRRPEGNWGSIYRQTDPHSFPSGHAARAVMLGILSLALGPQWFGLLLLAWAPFVGLARVSMGVHYVSDVAAGVILGVIMGLTLAQFYT